MNYDNYNWYRIIDILTSKDYTLIPTLNRAVLVNDLLSFARAEILDYEIALDALQYLRQETSYLPWKSALNGLKFLTKKFNGQKGYDLLRVRKTNQYENKYNQ